MIQTLQFITEAHAGQYWGDQEYWTHPVAVAISGVQTFGEAFTTDAVHAALLHDVIEDTEYTIEDLEAMGYNQGVLEAVSLLTKDGSLDYRANIQRIVSSGSRVAMMVKYADNTVNMSGDMSHMTDEKREKLQSRYAMSLEMLGDALDIH